MKKDKIENNINNLIRVIFVTLFLVIAFSISNRFINHNKVDNKQEYVLNHKISDSKAIIVSNAFVSFSPKFLNSAFENFFFTFSNINHILNLENNIISHKISFFHKKRQEIKSIAIILFYRHKTFDNSDDFFILS